MAKRYQLGNVPFYSAPMGGYFPEGSIVTVPDDFVVKASWGWTLVEDRPVTPSVEQGPVVPAPEPQRKPRRASDEDVL